MAANPNSTFSVIGSDVVIKGDVSASADLHVDGKIEGDIKCSSLVQGESSNINGSIETEIKESQVVSMQTPDVEIPRQSRPLSDSDSHLNKYDYLRSPNYRGP